MNTEALRAKRASVALERDQVVRELRDDPPDDLALAPRGVDRDDAAHEVERVDQLRDGRDLVGLLVGLDLPDDDALVRRVGADDAGLLAGRGARPPDALAVDVDPVAVRELEERVDPRQEAEVEDSGRQVGLETAFGRSVSVFNSQRPAASETGC